MATQADWEAKVEEIAALIGHELFGGQPLTDEQKLQSRKEAEDAVEAWEEAFNESPANIPPVTELRRLLAEQHESAEQILDDRDSRMKPDDD